MNRYGEIVGARTTDWLTDYLLIAQRGSDASGWWMGTAPTLPGPWLPVWDEYGCSMVAARNGHWLAFLSRAHDSVLFGPQGPVPGSGTLGLAGDIQAGRGVAAPDGTIALILNQQSGRGIRLARADGTYVDVVDAYPIRTSVCVVDRVRVFWRDIPTGEIRAFGMTPPKALPGQFLWPSWLPLFSGDWISYHSEDPLGFIMHRVDDASYGYRIANVPAFYCCAVPLDGTTIRAAWSLTPDDGSVRWTIIDTATQTPVRLIDVPQKPVSAEGDFMTLATFVDPAKGLVPVKTVKPVPGSNQLFTLIMPNDRVYSMQPDGSDGDRPSGADGGYEKCRVSGNLATFQPVPGVYYTRGFVVVTGL